MKPATLMPPPRPPRGGNTAMGAYDWHDNPNAGRAILLRYVRMFLNVCVLLLLATAVGQLAVVLIQIVRLGLFS